MFITYYVMCVIYCFYQLFKTYRRKYGTDPIQQSPELDAIMVLMMAWVLAPVDAALTWIRMVKDKDVQARIRQSNFQIDTKDFRNEETHIY